MQIEEGFLAEFSNLKFGCKSSLYFSSLYNGLYDKYCNKQELIPVSTTGIFYRTRGGGNLW